MDMFKSRVKTTEDIISEIEVRKTNQTEKQTKKYRKKDWRQKRYSDKF